MESDLLARHAALKADLTGRMDKLDDRLASAERGRTTSGSVLRGSKAAFPPAGGA